MKLIYPNILECLDNYDRKSKLLEQQLIGKKKLSVEDINDDLMYYIPIYDVSKRRYAAFCSLTEALWYKENDEKGNGHYFKNIKINKEIDWLMFWYLFRLCGSGINYKIKESNVIVDAGPYHHGFGNFWIIDSILAGRYTHRRWLKDLVETRTSYSDNKGYMLPLIEEGLKNFITKFSAKMIKKIYNYCLQEKRAIYQITDFGNDFLMKAGHKRQNFVLTAFAADISEYMPHLVDPQSETYAGTQAEKCIRLLFQKSKSSDSNFKFINEVLQFQSERYGLNPIDCEDSRNCDYIRYLKEYQSKHHIIKNKGRVYENNSIIKQKEGLEAYYTIVDPL